MLLRIALLIACVAGLAGCATAPRTALPPPAQVLQDAAFGPPSQPVDGQAVFALSDAMREHLARHAAGARRADDTRRFLLDMLYKDRQLALEYDSSVTRTAAEAFEARRGNCLSLVIMTGAFAKALNLPVRYQRVLVAEAWSRDGTLQFASGHVNLALEERAFNGGGARTSESALVVDFIPVEEARRVPAHPIGEATVVAMYMNNRAAETLAEGRIDDAYWWARGALLQDPAYANAYNTLGVVYLRRGLARPAQQLFDSVLAREPDNTKVMGNLVFALRQQGLQADAERVAARLREIEPQPPFHFFNAGLQAMREGRWADARALFRRELRREAHFHEIHFWLAQAELRLGNVRAAQRELETAREQSTTQRQQQVYAAKLESLRQVLR